MNVIIRNAVPADLITIIELTKEIAAFEKAAFNPDDKIKKLNKFLFEENPRIFCVLVTHENTPIGYVTYSIEFSLFEADNYLRINSFYIQPAFRRQGIGKLLMEEVKTICSQLHLESIRFFTPDFNLEAINFYKSIGASAVNSVRFYLGVKAQQS